MGSTDDSLTIKFMKAHPTVLLPQYATAGAAGMDICAFLPEPVALEPGSRTLIPTGLVAEIPDGYEGQIRPRSGRAFRDGLTVLNSPGTIDSDYRGEIRILLINMGMNPVKINNGDRIAQLVIAPVCRPRIKEMADLTKTSRGDGGFGSTGL
ncbi:deoxyuridine 5'-triphosphate nucleotidohydrolase [Spirochaetia bacterium]|nr:deoxyuridine 5'-triphosphate nucleotidohydrolase [Spirochaetia bacterium]